MFCHAKKCNEKFIPAMNMNIIAIISIALLSKYPMLVSCVEKPPIATVENECERASNAFIPAK